MRRRYVGYAALLPHELARDLDIPGILALFGLLMAEMRSRSHSESALSRAPPARPQSFIQLLLPDHQKASVSTVAEAERLPRGFTLLGEHQRHNAPTHRSGDDMPHSTSLTTSHRIHIRCRSECVLRLTGRLDFTDAARDAGSHSKTEG